MLDKNAYMKLYSLLYYIDKQRESIEESNCVTLGQYRKLVNCIQRSISTMLLHQDTEWEHMERVIEKLILN